MNFFQKIADSGVHFAQTPSEKRSILLSNVVSLIIFCLGMVLFIAYYFWYGWSVITVAIPVITILCLSTLLLNYYNQSIISRLWLCIFVPVITMSLSVYSKNLYYDRQEELDYFTFRFIILASCVFPAIFFSFKEKFLLIFSLLAGLILLMMHDPLHAFFGVPYYKHILKESNYYFTNVVILITWCVMVGAVVFLKRISEKSEERTGILIQDLDRINKELVEKSSEIESQNQEIIAQSENLNASQKNLQEAYRIIEEQKNLLLTQNKNLSTELLETNTDLTASNNELIKHNNELRQFSYTVSHNLRGPVASLLGLVAIVDSRALNRDNAEIFTHIKTSIERLDVIIRDLGHIIDIRQDIFQIRQKLNLRAEIEEASEILQKEIEAHQVNIKLNLDACTEIYSVKPMVQSILYNILSNAIKYKAPERKPEIEITSRIDEHYILEIKDNGLGIDLSQHKENLFKLYKRFHYHTEGKGLGLYLIKLQAEALGGRVEVESEINRYTKVIVYLGKTPNVERQILYQQPHAQIFYDARLNSTGVIWNGPVSSEQYRTVFLKCLEFVKVYNTPNYISDLSRQGIIKREDQLWMFSNIMPEAAKYGLKRIAGVRPDKNDPTIQQYLTGINENLTRLGILQEFFLSFDEAANWIEHHNETALSHTV